MTSLDTDVRQELGMHLRRLRHGQQLTLAELAGRVGITASALSQIERGLSEPSLGTLWRLGRALNASLFDFFAGQEAPTVDVTRAGDRTVVAFDRFRYEVMARSAQRGIDLFTLRLDPGDGPIRDPVGHAGEEAGVVVEGAMDVIVAGVTHRLGRGDAIWFVSSQPHTFAPAGDEPCLSVWADTIPDHAEPGGFGTVFGSVVASAPAPAPARPAPPKRTAPLDPLAVARSLPLGQAELRDVVDELAAVGSSPLGFRTTGTPEDRAVAESVARRMTEAGLADVALEEVAVDGWRFGSARVEAGALAVDGATFGGAPPTPEGGVRGRLVDVGGGDRRTLDRLEVAGAVVLVDWRKGPAGPSDIGLELGLRGAAAMLVAPGDGGPYFQAEHALGTFDGHWFAAAPPVMTIRREDAIALREALGAGPVDARVDVRCTVSPGGTGCNVVGHLAGAEPGPIVVGAHHDGWFHAAFDNATGVAAMLAIARALAAVGHVPRHTVCFTSRTAEEYGLVDRAFDWCVGAWRQVDVTHPEWGGSAPFHLCLEASGHPGLRLALEVPVELQRWARRAGRIGDAEGWLTSGWRTSPPVTGTEQWPLLVSGVPGVAAYTWESAFAKSIYHTPYDVPEIVDFAHLERLTRFYAFLLLDADRDPDGILDHRARGRHLAKAAAKLPGGGGALAAAAEAHGAAARGRAAFTTVGRELHAVTADGSTAYPHAQAAADAEQLEAALAAVRTGDRKRAARHVAKVGDNALASHLSEDALDRRAARRRIQHDDDSWAARSHLTDAPRLWPELAALRGEPGAKAAGAWVERSLERRLTQTRKELDRRVGAMARALGSPDRPDRRRST